MKFIKTHTPRYGSPLDTRVIDNIDDIFGP
jgi:hypothetical protein